ncbi:hypothetical protein ONZ45_g18857 [Pleurotus djamor]|nr:hypothetical protein ONZ45_g18857 [Pleurotus djamor]
MTSTRSPGMAFDPVTVTCPNAHISKLPDELLVKIMSLGFEHMQPRGRPSADIPEDESRRNIALVCKYWYNIVVTTPAFWTAIGPENNPIVLHAQLSHTGTDAPIKFIRSDFTRWVVPRQTIEIILDKLRRLEEFKTFVFPTDVPLVLQKLCNPAPCLKHLKIFVPTMKPDIEPMCLEGPEIFGDGSCPPQLRVLDLDGLCIPWTSPLFSPNLTSLDLDSQLPLKSYRELYDVLCNMKEVRRLSLRNCLPDRLTDNAPDLYLPNLHTLLLTDEPDFFGGFIRHLRVPPVDVILSGHADINRVSPVARECVQLFSPLLRSSSGPPSHSHLCTTLYLGGNAENEASYIHYRCVLTGRELLPETTEYELDGDFFIDVQRPLDHHMEALVDVLPLNEVRVLNLNYLPVDEDYFWIEIVGRKMPSLVTVWLGRPTYVGFLRAYGEYLGGLDAGSSHEDRLFAHLEEVYCSGLSGETQQLPPSAEEAIYLTDIRSKLDALKLPYVDLQDSF